VIRVFAITWGIWLSGYALVLMLDSGARLLLGARGVSQLQVLVAVVVVAGCAAGYFLAAMARWPMARRLLVLLVQVPPAYMAAVTMGIGYLCIARQQCPW
jgi:hypothetical protein